MSRLPVEDKSTAGSQVKNEVFMVNIDRAPITSTEVKDHTRRDPLLSKVLELTRNGWPENLDVDEEFKPFFRRKDELSEEDGVLLWGARVVVPSGGGKLISPRNISPELPSGVGGCPSKNDELP